MYVTAPPALHPASSLLGLLVRRWAADERQAESVYIVVAALVIVGAMLAAQWGWVLWGTDSALGFFAAQVVGAAVVGSLGLLGWRRPIHVHADDEGLRIRRGPDVLALSYDAIQSAERVPADAYHRHWRRYAQTRAFVNRLGDEVLLLRTASGPVILGVPGDDLARLDAHLAAQLEAEPHLVRAA